MKEELNKNNQVKTIITILVSIAFAVFFVWLAVRGLDLEKIKVSLLQADYKWVFISMFFAFLGYFFRAVRWNLLLNPVGYSIKQSNSLWSISFGYLMNLTIPRSGEIARATALYGVEKVPVDKSFATIIVERIVDLFFMFLFLLLTFIFNRDIFFLFFDKALQYREQVSQGNQVGEASSNLGLILVLSCVFFLCVLVFIKFKSKILGFVKGLFDGLKSTLQLKNKGLFFVFSCAIWVSYFLAAYLVCFSLPETSFFGIKDGFLLISAGTIGMIIPASGGIGSYHIVIKFAIAGIYLYLGKSEIQGQEVGLTYAFISHTSQLVLTILMGIISIPMLAKARKINP